MRTPNPKRILRGPRGAVTRDATPCAECVAFDCCRPGAINQPFGCDSWADHVGRRVDIEADYADLAARAGLIPEGLTPEDWADMTPAERETAEGLDAIARMPTPEEDAADLAEIDALESRFEPDQPGPLFNA